MLYSIAIEIEFATHPQISQEICLYLIHRTKRDKSVTILNEKTSIPVVCYIIQVYSSNVSILWIVTGFINPRDFFQCRISRNLSLGRNDFCGKI